jgi:ribonucleoside-diphosphate reductase alpha chain
MVLRSKVYKGDLHPNIQQQATMKVLKRNDSSEDVSFDKVLNRLKKLSSNLTIDVVEIAQKVCGHIYDGVRTSELDELAAQMCSSMIVDHPDYGTLAARIAVSNHHKTTSPSFSEVIWVLYNHYDGDGTHCPIVSPAMYDIVNASKDKLNSYIDYARDYEFDYFGFKTLEKSYLLRVDNVVVERPQHMWMRVALGIHGTDIRAALETYDLMSQKYFTHATPTLFNAGTPRPQCSSCFLYAMKHDSVTGIFESLTDCAHISKFSGGIGIHVHNIRSKGSRIRGTNGRSEGIIPMLRVFNATARYINQAGKRNGSIAVYLEPHHADIERFLDLRKNHGNDEERCRDLFTAVWVSDLFMERVEKDAMWSLMDPDVCPGLEDVYGDDYRQLYEGFEAAGKVAKRVKAQELWFKILESQIETGVPYLLFKDSINKKNNQSNLGTIKSSNLCTEITEFSSAEETAVCNLASLGLPKYVVSGTFDFVKLHEVTKVVTRNLNKIIDINFYPIESARRSNMRHRPIGIGIQGLADVFAMMRIPFDSDAARTLNKDIFETIYHAALESSMEIAMQRHDAIKQSAAGKDVAAGASNASNASSAKCVSEALSSGIMNEFERDAGLVYRDRPGAYASFDGSPSSWGILQYDMWDIVPGDGRHDWTGLKANIRRYGLRNSLLVAPMPTASTAQILGNNESFEPFTSNVFKRKTMSGEFIVANKYLIADLIRLKLWNNDMKQQLIAMDGSVQSLRIPDEIKALYKTTWEIKMKTVIDMAADRGAFIDQSQSMNLFVEDPDFKKLTSMHFYSWRKGLKTGMYYLRTRPKASTQKFTVDPNVAKAMASASTTSRCAEGSDSCLMCSS